MGPLGLAFGSGTLPVSQGLTSAQLLAASAGAAACVVRALGVVHKLSHHHGFESPAVAASDVVLHLRYEAIHLGVAMLLGSAQLVRVWARSLHC